MSEPTLLRDDLLKRINGKLAWIIFFLVLITLNTCSLDDSVEDAIRDMRRAERAERAETVETPAVPAAAADAATDKGA